MNDWTEISVSVNVDYIDKASAICYMAAKAGIYIEDYSDLEWGAREIAHIDLIDEDLLKKDRDTAIIHVYISPEDNPAEVVEFVDERLNACSIPHKTELKLCRNEDWENNWKKYYKPIKIGSKLIIRPLWINDIDADGRAVINLDPGVAFGTGTHETTRLCLEALEGCVKSGDEMLDIGCGSGILSVASLLLGAKKAVGVDIDRLAVKMARENGEHNGFSEPEYTVLEGSLTDKVSGKYDIVAANIVADAIIMLCKSVADFMKDGAKFITSGIIDLREEDVTKAFNENGFRIVSRYEDGGWLCFVLEKC